MAGAAIQPALQSWSIGQDNGTQQVGSEGRDASDIGVPYSDPNWGEGPLLVSVQPSGMASSIETASLDYYGDYQDSYPDRTPWPNYQGDPNRPSNSPIAYDGHDYDQGAPAAYRQASNPDIGKPVMQQYTVQSTDRQPRFDDIGYMVETPGERNAPVFNSFNSQNVNAGIGYYVQEDERPLFIQLAQVPGEYDGPGGLYQPDGTYSDTVYNDGGIPPAYVTPPDAPVSQSPAYGLSVDDPSYYGSF